MAKPGIKACSDEEFVRIFNLHGTSETAKLLGVSVRSIFKRKKNLSRFIPIASPSSTKSYPHRHVLDIKNGSVIIGSDFHIWPGEPSTALRAFKKFCLDIKPKAVILNGDVLDFPQISRHPPIGWENTPSPLEEIEAAQDHLHDISQAAGRCKKVWTLGNHDARFETRLATIAREYKGLKGIHLSDHFPLWEKGWSVWINDTVVIKHRWKGGVHANYNNTVYSGVTMVTGHLHSQKITPFTDYNGTRYGIDTGCVAETDHKAFTDYSEDSPRNWRSGFCVLTFKDGRLMYPELVSAWSDSEVQFRGGIHKV